MTATLTDVQTAITEAIASLHTYCLTGELRDMSTARQQIAAMYLTNPAAADSLWYIAMRVQRTMIAEEQQ